MEIIKKNREKAKENLERIKMYPNLNAVESRRRELNNFGIGQKMISKYLNSKWDDMVEEYGKDVSILLSASRECMQRLKPDRDIGLGLYIDSIRKIVQSRFKEGIILDIGCGMWVDASMSMVRNSNLKIQIMDTRALPLSFSAYQLTKRGIPHYVSLVDDLDKELLLVKKDIVMIIESTSFEHIKGIKTLFKPLLETLPKKGLFLSNYTRLDWSNPNKLDGHQENRVFAPEAKRITFDMMKRYRWEPSQKYWDLWERT